MHIQAQEKDDPDLESILPMELIDDLTLWLLTLQYAAQVVSVTLLVFRKPLMEVFSDACEHGIREYTS